MYLKRLVLLISLLGLMVAGYFSWQIYGLLFNPNTNFEQSHVMVRIDKDDSFENIFNTLKPFLENPLSFKTVAKKRALTKYIQSGVFKIEKGMSNTEIIDVLTINHP